MRPSSWFTARAFCWVLVVGGVREFSRVSFIRALTPFTRAPSLWLNHLPEAPPPNITLRVRFPTCEFGGTKALKPGQSQRPPPEDGEGRSGGRPFPTWKPQGQPGPVWLRGLLLGCLHQSVHGAGLPRWPGQDPQEPAQGLLLSWPCSSCSSRTQSHGAGCRGGQGGLSQPPPGRGPGLRRTGDTGRAQRPGPWHREGCGSEQERPEMRQSAGRAPEERVWPGPRQGFVERRLQGRGRCGWGRRSAGSEGGAEWAKCRVFRPARPAGPRDPPGNAAPSGVEPGSWNVLPHGRACPWVPGRHWCCRTRDR